MANYSCEKCENPFTQKSHSPLKPMVKWSGGKKDEIKMFVDYVPKTFDTYLEPFAGGGAVFFHLRPAKSVISDVHKELVDFYKCIQKGYSKEIYDFMSKNKNEPEAYYKVRDNFEVITELDNGKRFYYLRKTCYRGMLRYNKSGKFNIPFGRYKTYNYEILKDKAYEDLLKGVGDIE